MAISHQLQADFTEIGVAQFTSYANLKLSMGDSTLHSVSVIAVVSERQGENHFSLNQKPIAQPDRAR